MKESRHVNTGDRLSFTAFLAIAFHALLLFGISFTIEHGEKVAPTLNITLATHKTEKAPERADFLAQHNQEASGRADEAQELLTRERADFAAPEIREISPPPQQKTQRAAERQNEIIKTTGDSQFTLAKNDKPDDEVSKEEKEAQEFDIRQTSAEKAALLAKLDKLNQKEALRPRIRRMTSVSTKSSIDAAYLNTWNSRIEQVGNTNFPQAAIQNRIFGELVIAVALNANGSIHNVKVVTPSKHAILNQAAQQIIHLAAPFRAIPGEVLDGHDKLEIIRTWKFEITGLSSTSASN